MVYMGLPVLPVWSTAERFWTASCPSTSNCLRELRASSASRRFPMVSIKISKSRKKSDLIGPRSLHSSQKQPHRPFILVKSATPEFCTVHLVGRRVISCSSYVFHQRIEERINIWNPVPSGPPCCLLCAGLGTSHGDLHEILAEIIYMSRKAREIIMSKLYWNMWDQLRPRVSN